MRHGLEDGIVELDRPRDEERRVGFLGGHFGRDCAESEAAGGGEGSSSDGWKRGTADGRYRLLSREGEEVESRGLDEWPHGPTRIFCRRGAADDCSVIEEGVQGVY